MAAAIILAPGRREYIRFERRGRRSRWSDGYFCRTTLDVADRFDQSLTLFGRCFAIDLQQFSETAYEGWIGQQLRPVRTRAGILGLTHKKGHNSPDMYSLD